MIKETMFLLSKGYSKKEIDAMLEADKQQAAAEAAEAEKQAQQQAAQQQAAQQQADNEAQKKIEELQAQITALQNDLKNAQASNVNTPAPAANSTTARNDLLNHLADLM